MVEYSKTESGRAQNPKPIVTFLNKKILWFKLNFRRKCMAWWWWHPPKNPEINKYSHIRNDGEIYGESMWTTDLFESTPPWDE